MILVTGANGQLGGLAINFLNEKTSETPIAGFVRSEEKGAALKVGGVEVRIGDYLDKASVVQALDGVETVVLISSSTLGNRANQHKNVIDAAVETGVKHIFYTSLVKADEQLSPLAADHYETEKYLAASGIDYTIFRNTFYAEFFPMFLGNALNTGEWAFPSGGKTANFAFRTEMAEALANAVLKPEQHKNKIYEITSGAAYTFAQLADMIHEKSGKKIDYKDLPVDAFMNVMNTLGLDEATLAITKISAETVVNGALSHTSGDLAKLLGREPATVEEMVNQLI